jgi:hypothetical protein
LLLISLALARLRFSHRWRRRCLRRGHLVVAGVGVRSGAAFHSLTPPAATRRRVFHEVPRDRPGTAHTRRRAPLGTTTVSHTVGGVAVAVVVVVVGEEVKARHLCPSTWREGTETRATRCSQREVGGQGEGRHGARRRLYDARGGHMRAGGRSGWGGGLRLPTCCAGIWGYHVYTNICGFGLSCSGHSHSCRS